MSEAAVEGFEKRGWCPGARRPMASGDGLVVRVRPQRNRLEPGQAAALAALARRFGDGGLELTQRANLQIRGVAERDHEELLAGLDAFGLLDPDPLIEARRNVVVTPFHEPRDGVAALAGDLEAALAAARDLPLPGKFGFAVDHASRPVLRAVSADIRLERAGERVAVFADGARRSALIDAARAVDAALDLARWFLGVRSDARRMRDVLLGGLTPPSPYDQIALADPEPFAAEPGPTPQGLLAAFAFGRIEAAGLEALSAIAPLRLTPWRMVFLEGADEIDALPDAILDPREPLLRVEACPGAPSCAQALQPTRDLARALAPRLRADERLHVSGCAKGCAWPRYSEHVLTATPDGFRHGRNARAADADSPVLTPDDLFGPDPRDAAPI